MQAKILEVIKVGTVLTRSIPPYLIIHAEGWVTTSGWLGGTLLPWVYIAPPADGILDLDFVATPPHGPALMVLTRIEAHAGFIKPKWVKGVRIHSSLNQVVDDNLYEGGNVVFAKEPRIARGDSFIPIPWARDPGDSWPWLAGEERG